MFRTRNVIRCVIVSFFIGFFLIILFPSCGEDIRNRSHAQVSLASIEKGRILAVKYCQSCHMLPDPAWLGAQAWEMGALPFMGPRLGILQHNFKSYPYEFQDRAFYPSQPLLSPEDWQHIINYYTATSPDTLSPRQNRERPIQNSLPLFVPQTSSFLYNTPVTSFVKINSGDADHPLVVGDALTKKLYRLNKQLQPVDSVRAGSIVDVDMSEKEWWACDIGIMNPNNGKYGKIQPIHITDKGRMQVMDSALFKELSRPVQVTTADLNKDGKLDYIINEFGYLQGSLTWMENLGEGHYSRHVLRSLPGAIKIYVQDYNKDGLPDIWALFAQGEEGIFLFTNKGNGQFDQQEVLRFPPVYGSSYFEMDDFNKDGHPDIVYTCGDNADYTPVLKPYHGVYIFMNDGHNRFQQQCFFPINGCYKAIARDFDGDGDLDIATISFFADYQRQPEEGFVYLENKGNFHFWPYSLPQTQAGRWLTMDAGDFDGDGRIDLVLGNFSVAPAMMRSKMDWKKGPPFLLLKNVGK